MKTLPTPSLSGMHLYRHTPRAKCYPNRTQQSITIWIFNTTRANCVWLLITSIFPPQHRPLFNFGWHFVRLGNHFLGLGNDFLALGNDFVVLQNGFVRLGNGFVVLQNGFVALGNGFVALRNGFLRLGNHFRALQSLSRGHFFAKTGLGAHF